jgi:hypothetical protein
VITTAAKTEFSATDRFSDLMACDPSSGRATVGASGIPAIIAQTRVSRTQGEQTTMRLR